MFCRRRGGSGEGSVYRRKDGLWVEQYKIQTQNGAKTKYIYSKTRKEAASKLADALAERDSGLVYECGSISLGDYLVRWLEDTKGTVGERTWIRAEIDVRVHIDPVLGRSKLDRSRALQLQSFYRTKLDSGCPPGRCR